MKLQRMAKELRGNEFKIYSVINNRSGEYSNTQLAKRCNVTAPTIKRNVERLVNDGYIKKEERHYTIA